MPLVHLHFLNIHYNLIGRTLILRFRNNLNPIHKYPLMYLKYKLIKPLRCILNIPLIYS